MDKSARAREILETSNDPIITINVLEEAVYVGLSLIYGCYGFKLRDQLKKELKGTARIFLEQLKSFLIEYRIEILSTPEDPDLLLESVATYRLLPNDAAIVAACRYYGIKRIATFDSDFNRVEFLNVIGFEAK
jgi:predicted nucleic acid-binding protein